MASREERMQSRLRGAQRRTVKDVDFGLSFPAAPADSNTNPPFQDSPQIQLPPSELPRPSTLQTPATLPQASISAATQDIIRVSHSTNDANTSAKRRKLDTDITPTSSRSTRSGNPPRRDIYALEENDQNEEPEPDSSLLEPADVSMDLTAPNNYQFKGHPDASLLTESDDEPVAAAIPEPETVAVYSSPVSPARTPLATTQSFDEVTESPQNAPGSGRRTRVAVDATIQASSQLQGIQDSDPLGEGTATPVTQRKRRREEYVPKPTPASRSRESQTPSALDELDELSPEQITSRSHRPKAVVEVSVSDVDENPREQDEPAEAEEIDDEQAAAVLKKNRGRRISRRFAAESPDLGTPQVSSAPVSKNPKGRHRAQSSPVQQRHPKKAASKAKPAKKPTKKLQVGAGSPIPVTVHRLTKPPLYDENELDADVLNSEIPHIKRGGVNTIDVLSEVCLEMITTSLNRLEEMGNACEESALRREYKTKWNAVDAFGKELQTRLLEHTINLDNGYSLERRVRDEQKKKLALREDILRIRKDREQVALRMDEIRMKHEKEKTTAQGRDTLNTAVHDIELAIEMGKRSAIDQPNEMIGTELLLKRVAGEVSNKGDSGGFLRQIKEFNAFLERTALVLEGRKV